MKHLGKDDVRSARLLFAPERAAGLVHDAQLDHPDVALAVTARGVPSRLVRRLQQRWMRSGRVDAVLTLLAPLHDARRAVLGDAAEGRPRVALRVHAQRMRTAIDAAGILAALGVPVLIAAAPDDDDDDLQALADLCAGPGDVSVALTLDLERVGVDDADGRQRRAAYALAVAHGRLALAESASAHTRAVVAADDALLADRDVMALSATADLVLAGPAAVGTIGLHAGPLYRGDAPFALTVSPLHGDAPTLERGVGQLERLGYAAWAPACLVADGVLPDALERLAERLGPVARPWGELFAAIDASATSAPVR